MKLSIVNQVAGFLFCILYFKIFNLDLPNQEVIIPGWGINAKKEGIAFADLGGNNKFN